MTVLARTKTCDNCGAVFVEKKNDSHSQWEARSKCSKSCAAQTPKMPIEERFWDKVDIQDDCWVWTGTRSRGYGLLSNKRGGTPFKAYRISYELYVGEIPDGCLVRHTCDNPACVNPDHLTIGTHKENARDMVERGRLNPKSLLNLRPGKKGFVGAGPLSRKDLLNVCK